MAPDAETAVNGVETDRPHVLVAGDGLLPQRARAILTTATWASTIVVTSVADLISPHLVITPEAEVNDLWLRYPRAAFLSISPHNRDSEVSAIDAADTLQENFAADDLKRKVFSLLSRRGYLLLLLQDLDASAEQLARTESCEWVRSRIAIVGLTTITKREQDGPKLRSQISRAVTGAHALLDSLPDTLFTINDAWNLVLLISLPWSEQEAIITQSLFDVLAEVERDLGGSRKILLWRGTSPSHHLDRFSHDGTSWVPSSPDPLRDAVRQVARNTDEAAALEVLFRSRITEGDLEHLIDILAKDEG